MGLGVKVRSRLIEILLTAALAASASRLHPPAEAHRFNVPAEDAPAAIRDFASQANVQILVAGENVKDKRLRPVFGEFSTEQGLQLLLAGSGLTPQYIGDRSIALVATPTSSSLSSNPSPATGEGARSADEGSHKSFWDRYRLSQTDQAKNSNGGSVDQQSPKGIEGGTLAEVIVTAQKRSELLQNVPVPVSAINAELLVASNQTRLQDYYDSVPGLNISPTTELGQDLSIRGITTGGFTNPTVGITVDDVPYGGSTNFGAGRVVPDFDPGDLARVEVLRGPQGTLYGASSMGGLVKFVTVDPSTDAFSGSVQAGTDGVRNGDGLGYNVRGSVNVPLGDTLAMRASAFYREDPGYIDNPITGDKGVNKDNVYGGRFSALWKPSDTFSLKISALAQDFKGNGSNDVDVPTAGFPETAALGDLQQIYLRGLDAFERKVQAYSATATAKIDGVDLTSVSGYNVNTYSDSFDYTYAYGPLFSTPNNPAGVPVYNQNRNDKFTQEFRLSSSIGKSFDWLLGAFYTTESADFQQAVDVSNPTTGAIVATPVATSIPTNYTEYAVFSDLTYHFTEQFDVQIGARESEIHQDYSQTQTGPAASPNIAPLHTSANAFTYLLTPQFHISTDIMLYARLASGYRAGGANPAPGGVVPAQYNPDKTEDYDLGLKADILDHTLSVDASIYYINWKNIQIDLTNPTTHFGYNSNGSGAKSQGVELSIVSRPVSGLTIEAWGAFDDAVLTEAFPLNSQAYGVAGNRLPYSSRFSGHVSVDEQFRIASAWTGFVGASLSYVGNREGEFNSPPPAVPPRQYYPGYAKADFHVGAKYDTWTINAYVNNVTDRRGELSGGIGYTPPFAFQIIQPRTVGVFASKSF